MMQTLIELFHFTHSFIRPLRDVRHYTQCSLHFITNWFVESHEYCIYWHNLFIRSRLLIRWSNAIMNINSSKVRTGWHRFTAKPIRIEEVISKEHFAISGLQITEDKYLFINAHTQSFWGSFNHKFKLYFSAMLVTSGVRFVLVL